MNHNPRKNIGPERIRATVAFQRPSAPTAEPPIVPSTPPAAQSDEFGRDKPCWPRNESEIELPTEAPPVASPVPAGRGYIGAVIERKTAERRR